MARNSLIVTRRNCLVLMSSLTSALLFQGFAISEAYVYIDSGSGSAVIQMLIGALAGIGIALKVYWHSIKEKLVRKYIAYI